MEEGAEWSSDPEVLEWAEKAAIENLKFHGQCADALAREASTTLAVLLAGMGAALAHVIQALDRGSAGPLVGVSAALGLGLAVLGLLVVTRCMRIEALAAPTNEPGHLALPGFSVAQLRRAELCNMQARILQAVARNERTTGWLNRARLWAVYAVIAAGLLAVGFSARTGLAGLGAAAGCWVR